MAARASDFKVTITSKDVVAADVLPLQEHSKLPLSNMDLLLPPVHLYLFFCYKNNESNVCYENKGQQDYNTFKSKVSTLKKALALALAYYYPFAGEIVLNSSGEPEILCNNRGVEFTEAFADVDLIDLNLYNLDERIEGKLLPCNKDAIFTVQVTELKCGGMVVACLFDHRVADAYSVNMFWVTWAEIATFKPISTKPYLCRSLFNPRDPLVYDSYENIYVPISSLPISSLPARNPDELQRSNPLITRVYFIPKDQVESLQSLCIEKEVTENGSCKKYSKLQSFSAFLWQIVASHACELGLDYVNKTTMMGIIVDGRTRLSNGESIEKAQNFDAYFGNVVIVAFGEQLCRDMKDMPISTLAKLVHKFLGKAMTKDHFLGLIDWVEAQHREPFVPKMCETKEDDGPAFVVSSGLRFPFSKVDFGWGKPCFGSYHFPWGNNVWGYVMPIPCPLDNENWIVYMHLRKEQFDYIEAKASHVFKPFSFDMID